MPDWAHSLGMTLAGLELSLENALAGPLADARLDLRDPRDMRTIARKVPLLVTLTTGEPGDHDGMSPRMRRFYLQAEAKVAGWRSATCQPSPLTDRE